MLAFSVFWYWVSFVKLVVELSFGRLKCQPVISKEEALDVG